MSLKKIGSYFGALSVLPFMYGCATTGDAPAAVVPVSYELTREQKVALWLEVGDVQRMNCLRDFGSQCRLK